ncbi:glycosyltransferase [Flavobacterium sp.]|uniref:glycosyltransferase n=1 Tax=Flavobacterium sp. TaxID=239 RepID=UPI003750AFF0
MTQSENKISVAVCTYNGERYLEKQLNSILNQTLSVNEIVVCDDCSSDKTIAILNLFKEKFPAIFKIYSNSENLRSNKNFEKAISLCTGDFIFLSDQDDLWKPEKVATIIDVFKSNPSAEGVFSDANFIDENDIEIHQEMSLWQSVCFFDRQNDIPINLYESLLYLGNFLTGATLCIRKEVLPFCIPFETIDSFIHDEWLAYVLSKRNTLFLTKEKLISYRLHSNQQLGVGKIKDARKKIIKNENHNKLILNIIPAIKFNDFKAKSRAYFYQYEKYFYLNEKYENDNYYEISETLKQKHLDAEIEMKKSNLILYLIRKYKDRRKKRRQIHK